MSWLLGFLGGSTDMVEVKNLQMQYENTISASEANPKAIPICGFKATDGSFHETEEAALEVSKAVARRKEEQRREKARSDCANALLQLVYAHWKVPYESQNRFRHDVPPGMVVNALVFNPTQAIRILNNTKNLD